MVQVVGNHISLKKISSLLSIKCYDLDDIFWDNSFDTFGKKANPEISCVKLWEILSKEEWIIEGVYYSWLWQSFAKADTIFILKPSIYLQHQRVIVRFLKRRAGFIKSKKKETLKSLFDLLKWNHKYNKITIPTVMNLLGEFKDKIVVVTDNAEILTYVLRDVHL